MYVAGYAISIVKLAVKNNVDFHVQRDVERQFWTNFQSKHQGHYTALLSSNCMYVSLNYFGATCSSTSRNKSMQTFKILVHLVAKHQPVTYNFLGGVYSL